MFSTNVALISDKKICWCLIGELAVCVLHSSSAGSWEFLLLVFFSATEQKAMLRVYDSIVSVWTWTWTLSRRRSFKVEMLRCQEDMMMTLVILPQLRIYALKNTQARSCFNSMFQSYYLSDISWQGYSLAHVVWESRTKFWCLSKYKCRYPEYDIFHFSLWHSGKWERIHT
jgi:hypothetical protein